MLKRIAILKTDNSGRRLVKAVVEGSQVGLFEGSENTALIDPETSPKRIIGCQYINEQFVRIVPPDRKLREQARKDVHINKIVWCYHDFNYGNSLAHVSRESCMWMKRIGIPIKILQWDRNLVPLDLPAATNEDIKNSAVIVMDRYPVPKYVYKMLARLEAPYVFGYYMLEGTQLRTDALNHLERYDAVFTPSTFCKKAMEDSGLSIPVLVWGHGIDPNFFPYVEPKPNRPFTFLWFGDENRRKGYDLFLEAFSRLKIPNVRAWVRGPGSGGIAKIRKKYEGDNRIVWDTRVTPPEQLKDMFAEADVLVMPLRGEGFCLPALEAMAAGRPVIMTKWSGVTDFGTDELTYWVNIKGYESAQNDDGVQAVPSLDHLIEQMTWCAEHPEDVIARGRASSQYVHAKWTWGKKVKEVISLLQQVIPACNFGISK
jgi:glycosyltransferase involved in cell wall biosynthesis